MHLNQANLANLTGLWKKYGSCPGNTLPFVYSNARWPYRCWIEWSGEVITYGMQEPVDDFTWLNNIPSSAILPVWQITKDSGSDAATALALQLLDKYLLENDWRCSFEQLAMYLELSTCSSYLVKPRSGFRVIPVRTLAEVKTWVEIGSEAFNYTIDYGVIEDLRDDEDIQMLLGWQDGQAVCCALMYKTGEFIGIHQVGVKQVFQGQGIARCFMQHIIQRCVQWQGKYVVLQASQLGRPLYESLGFSAQFKIKNYQKRN
jgi:GNAT superfamily N-acetyltransferase